ncbi:MAG: hypothetical protein AABM40_04555 [Chloroflexota bacterium]
MKGASTDAMRAAQRRRWNRSWAGIEPATMNFVYRMINEQVVSSPYRTWALQWFAGLRDAGLPTSLDADLEDPKFRDYLDEILAELWYPGLEKKRGRHIQPIKNGMKMYDLAAKFGERTRPVPEFSKTKPRPELTGAQARLLLPAADLAKVEAIEKIIRAKVLKQWTGEGVDARKGPDGYRRKATLSISGGDNLIKTVEYFLRYAALQKWEPFTLDGLLTSERIVDFLYYGGRLDGSGLSEQTIEIRASCLLDFFARGRIARKNPIVVITAEHELEIKAAMAEEELHRDEWNCKRRPDGNSARDDTKWYPEVDQVALAIAALEEQLARADERHGRGQVSDYAYWLELRNTVLTLCTLYCMWRVDTATTGSLLHLRTDPITGTKVDEDRFAVMVKIARAKSGKAAWYPFVPELLIPPVALRQIEKLLAFEKRSLTRPLRDGEYAVRLSAAKADRWGADPVLVGELTVVPIFRVRPDAPEGLAYGTISGILENQLARLRFGATNPHTLRAAGAIYWSYIQQMPDDLIMTLGLWEDPTTLNDCYKHLTIRDQRKLMARHMPAGAGAQPKRRGRREQAASAALGVVGKLLEKPTGAYEARRLLGELRHHCEEIDQTIASELGLRWEPFQPSPFQPGELERIEAALRDRGYDQGIASVIGRDLFAREQLQSYARNRASGIPDPLAPRRIGAPAPRLALPFKGAPRLQVLPRTAA